MVLEQLSLVSQGGGIGGGAYVVGVMKALKEYGVLSSITRTYTSSSATPAVIYPLLGKDRLLEYVWTEKVTGPEVIDLRRAMSKKPALDIDHLVDGILAQHPFDARVFREHPVEMHISTTKVGDELEHYFLSNRDPYQPLLMIKASIAIPLLYGKLVSIGDADYIDGGIMSQLLIPQAPYNESMIVVVTNHKNKFHGPSLGERQLLRLDRLRKKTPFSILAAIQRRHSLYAYEYDQLVMSSQHKPDVVIIQPEKPLPASIVCNKPKLVTETIKRGYDDTLAKMLGIEALLNMRKAG